MNEFVCVCVCVYWKLNYPALCLWHPLNHISSTAACGTWAILSDKHPHVSNTLIALESYFCERPWFQLLLDLFALSNNIGQLNKFKCQTLFGLTLTLIFSLYPMNNWQELVYTQNLHKAAKTPKSHSWSLSFSFFVSPSFIFILNFKSSTSSSSSFFTSSASLSSGQANLFWRQCSFFIFPSGGVRFIGPIFIFIFITNFSFSLLMY